MARQVRIRVSGGMYHVFTRGHNRERIFGGNEDRARFLELVERMRTLYRLRVYAYCLMPNHYHLLVSTPEANVSRAVQWLNGSYGIWYNRKHNRGGHLFGERFKGVLVENGARGVEVSVYMHMNPVATVEFGLGKKEKVAQSKGMGRPPAKEDMEQRLDRARKFPWSSYRAYAGYTKMPEWLDSGGLLQRMGKGLEVQTKAYRQLFEERIRQGVEEDLWSQVRWGVVLGGERFARKVRGRLVISPQSKGQRELGTRRTFAEIVRLVERIKKEPWGAFRDRYGDWGRDLALWAGRRYCGLKLTELSAQAGGIGDAAVTLAVQRLEKKASRQKAITRAMKAITRHCKL